MQDFKTEMQFIISHMYMGNFYKLEQHFQTTI